MLTFLYNYSDWLIVAIMTLGITILAVCFSYAVRLIIPANMKQVRFSNIEEITTNLVAASAIMIAFSIVYAQTQMETLQKSVVREASSLVQINTLLKRFDLAETQDIRTSLHQYTESIVKDEWDAMRYGEGEGLKKTNLLQENFLDKLMQLTPNNALRESLYMEVLREVHHMRSQHTERVRTAATVGISPVFWGVIAALIGLVAFVGAFATTALFRVQIVALALLTSVLFILDHPYLGDSSIDLGPFRDALVLMH